MAESAARKLLEEFAEFLRVNEPLGPYCYLKLGGPAEMLVQPRSVAELSAVVRRCFERQIPLRVLGSGCNVLVRDEGVRGAVLRLSKPAFTSVTVEGRRIKAGAGASLSALISEAARHALAGLERDYLNAMGAPPGSTEITEPANQETGKTVRRRALVEAAE